MRGRHVGEDAEPAEGVRPLEDPGEFGGDRLPRDPPEAVAADYVVALQDVLAALVAKPHPRAVAVRALDGQRLGLEQQRSALLELQGDEVLAHLGLGVDHHGPSAGEGGEVHAMTPPGVPQLDAVVPQPLTVHALTGTGRAQHVHRALFEDPGALALLDVGAVAAFEHDRVDSGVVEQPGQEQSGGAGSDDAYGGAHPASFVRPVKITSPTFEGSFRPTGPAVNGSRGEVFDAGCSERTT